MRRLWRLVRDDLAAAAPPTPDDALVEFVLALEDRRFWRHAGVDPIAVLRAAARALVGSPVGGASTIDMQLVRTVTNRRDRTLARKAMEMVLALLLRRRFGPRRIMHRYMEVVFLGTDLHGVEAAAAAVFGRPVPDCTSREKAMLAAMLLSPAPADPSLDWWARVWSRSSVAMARVEAGRVAPPRSR